MSSVKKRQQSTISKPQSTNHDPKNEKVNSDKPESETAKPQWRRSPSMWDSANIFSKLYCLYVFPFMYRNYKKDFDLSALSEHAKRDDCIRLGERLKVNWARGGCSGESGQFGILRNIIPLVLGRVILYSNLYFQDEVEQEIEGGVIPTLVNRNATNGNVNNNNNFLNLSHRQNFVLFSGLLVLLALLNILIPHPFFMTRYRLGMNFRTALTRLIYEKALRVSGGSVQRFTVGKIVNLISNDVNRFEVVFVNVDFSYLAMPYTAIAMAILYWYFGRASLGALAIAVVYIPFQSIMANILSRFRSVSIQLTDDRLRLMSEILPAMRVIKMYVWEVPFSRLVHIARKLEIGKIRQSMMLRCVNLALFFVSSKVMAFVCIILFLLDGGELNAEIVFVSMSMFSQIRENLTYHFPFGTAIGIETYISIKRIEKFLLVEEVSEDRPQTPEMITSFEPSKEKEQKIKKGGKQEGKISLKNVTVYASERRGGSTPILKDISFEVRPGQLTVIVGPVGSGKSSVLLTILREMSNVDAKSRVEVNGSLVYVSQEAVIFAGTVRENVLFGRPLEEGRYREAIQFAALEADLKQFEHGDLTSVDDRGTSLSGGQRARISLARALYTDADCFLLDDPLSAVDAAVAKQLFEQCIKGYLSRKVVVLVTHQLQYVKQAEQIVVLKQRGGETLAVGSYTDLLKAGVDLYKLISHRPSANPSVFQSIADKVSLISSAINSSSLSSAQAATSAAVAVVPFRVRMNSLSSDIYRASRTTSFTSYVSYSEDEDHEAASSSIDQMSLFEAAAGSKRFDSPVVNPMDFHGISNKPDTIELNPSSSSPSSSSAAAEVSAAYSLYSTQKKSALRTLVSYVHENVNKAIYTGIILALFFFAILRTVSYFVICMRSSVALHNRIFPQSPPGAHCLLRPDAGGRHHEPSQPDLGIIDDLLPPTGFETLEILGNCLGIFVLCTALNPIVAVPLVLLAILVVLGTRFYVTVARKVKRLEGVARSPLFNQLAATLGGLPTIRSYGTQKLFIEAFSAKQNLHTSAYFTYLSLSRLFGVYLELICFAYIFCLILYMNVRLDEYSGSIIGLTISQAIALADSFQLGQYCEVENYMTSVERVVEFGKLDREALDSGTIEPSESWPTSGRLTFEHVSLTYQSDPSQSEQEQVKSVLTDLCFSIRSGEKVGIVGRTGAGKSSLITTLFRLTAPSGTITLDGVDTASISLSRLRKALSIIPQEPILFSGSVRRNLDPFSARRPTRSSGTPWRRLESSVSVGEAGGVDFSVGEKQLVCLARAILRKCPVLVLDEATANVDPRTDAFIQATIRSEFSQQTVLTIAHRLNTVIDYDRVMVLDAGRLMQFDRPLALIDQGEGIFFELYSALQTDVKAELRTAAEKAAKADEKGFF
ncbi:Multidrug resistance-associated protein 4 [Tyrophagus putrescentiae]|nr:Multidrug resistance-associated protein 4 [Tyrophagus putrescentiae]